MCVPGSLRGQKMALVPLELELELGASAWGQIWNLGSMQEQVPLTADPSP